MLDLQFICENQALVEENCRNRAVRVDLARLVELARQRSHLIVEGDKHRHEQKEIAAQIPKVSDKEQRQTLIDRGKQLKQLVAENEASLKTLEAPLRERGPGIRHRTTGAQGDVDLLGSGGQAPHDERVVAVVIEQQRMDRVAPRRHFRFSK